MCNSRNYDIISAAASLIGGVLFTILAIFNLVTSFIIGPWLSIALGAFALVLLAISVTSLLRQDDNMNRCVCERAPRLLLSAMALIAVSAFAVLFALTNLLISLILTFIISTLFIYTFLSLYCLLSCMISAGCKRRCGC